MAQRVVVDCDRCGVKDLNEPVRIHLATGRSPDPAGGHSEEDTERVDLCNKCAGRSLNNIAGKLSYEAQSKLLSDIRSYRKSLKS